MGQTTPLVPKRKFTFITTPGELEALTEHITQSTIATISRGIILKIGKFDWELKIPVGTDMFPGGH